jgi:serine/threonine protein kinase
MAKAGDDIAGYEVLGELSPSRSYRARSMDGRIVVLKALEADCLLSGDLHPSIRQRLSRVRELPHKRVANLHGVDRARERVYLVWDFVDGEPLGQAIKGRSAWELARELALSVEEMHAAGIVHGAIHEGNVFIDRRGDLWLTDVSPLLWTDPQDDALAVVALLEEVAAPQDPALRAVLGRAKREKWGLAQLVRALWPAGEQATDNRELQEDARLRRSALIWAAIAAAAALTVALAVAMYA